MFRIEKIIIAISFFLILIGNMSSAFNEYPVIKLSDDSKCKEKLNLAASEDKIRIIISERECIDISLYLKIGEKTCGELHPLSLKFNQTKQENQIICETALNEIYKKTCRSEDSRNKIGEITNKDWEIKFGWNNQVGVYSIGEFKRKILDSDDLNEKCENLNRRNNGIRWGIPITSLLIFLTIISFRYKSRVGEILGFILTLISLSITLINYIGWF